MIHFIEFQFFNLIVLCLFISLQKKIVFLNDVTSKVFYRTATRAQLVTWPLTDEFIPPRPPQPIAENPVKSSVLSSNVNLGEIKVKELGPLLSSPLAQSFKKRTLIL